MIADVKKGRVWLKSNKKYKNKFLEIFIENNSQKISFIAMIPQDGRFYIPLEIRKSLRIKNKINIEKIEVLKNEARKPDLIKNNQINILSIIPHKTLSGYDILVTNKNDKHLCWYCTQGRPKELLLEKRVPLLFSRFLGYYQAEGGKPKLRNRRGRTFSFTNTKLALVKDFLTLSKELLDIQEWKTTIIYNPKIEKRIISELYKELEREGLKLSQIRCKPAEKIKNYCITLWISNSLLAEIIENLNCKIKELITKKENEEIFEQYFRGLIAGDGTFYAYRDKNGSLHSRVHIYEEKESYINSHKINLESYGLKGKIKKEKDKNLYVLTINNNWEDLLKLLKHDIFLNAPHHKNRLIWTIKNHKKYKALKHLINLKEIFDVKDLIKITNKGYSYCGHWTEKRKKERLISFVNKTNGRSVWQLTSIGQKTKEILKRAI